MSLLIESLMDNLEESLQANTVPYEVLNESIMIEMEEILNECMYMGKCIQLESGASNGDVNKGSKIVHRLRTIITMAKKALEKVKDFIRNIIAKFSGKSGQTNSGVKEQPKGGDGNNPEKPNNQSEKSTHTNNTLKLGTPNPKFAIMYNGSAFSNIIKLLDYIDQKISILIGYVTKIINTNYEDEHLESTIDDLKDKINEEGFSISEKIEKCKFEKAEYDEDDIRIFNNAMENLNKRIIKIKSSYDIVDNKLKSIETKIGSVSVNNHRILAKITGAINSAITLSTKLSVGIVQAITTVK